MAKTPEIILPEANENIAKTETIPAVPAQKTIYPEVSERLKSLAVWFAVAFIIFAVVIQKYSAFF